MLWKVPTHILFTTSSPRYTLNLACISFAALFVKVTAKTSFGLAPEEIKLAILEVKTLVFPEPAPAKTKIVPFFSVTAWFCSLFNPFKYAFSLCMAI